MKSIITGVLALSSMSLLGACSSHHPAVSAPTPSTSIRDSVAPHMRVNSWSPRVTSGRWHYIIQDSSIVSISNDTSARAMPIKSRTVYSVSILDSSNVFLVDAQVDSFYINTNPRKNNTDTTKTAGFHSRIGADGKVAGVLVSTPISCSDATNSSVGRLGEVRVVVPRVAAKAGDKWADTSSTTICHGRIPLLHHAVREYELVDLLSCQPGNGVKVRRVVTDSFTSSTESSNHLSASGSGSGTSVLCLQRDSGMVITSDGQSRLDLTVTTSRGTFPFTQNTSTHIELVK